MYERAFEGLTISPAQALAVLETAVDRLCAVVGEAEEPGSSLKGRPSALALGALAYFVIERDVVRDESPGGLADDVTLLVSILREIEPARAADLPAPGSRAGPVCDLAAIQDRLLELARALSPVAVTERARRNVAAVRRAIAAPGARVELKARARRVAAMYMGMIAFAMWAGGRRARTTGRRRRKERTTASAPQAGGADQPPVLIWPFPHIPFPQGQWPPGPASPAPDAPPGSDDLSWPPPGGPWRSGP
jgi:hypothetical protein